MTYKEKMAEMFPSVVKRPWWAISIATKDFSKTAESVWGIALYNMKTGESYSKYFGDPAEGSLAFDNVVPWRVESLTSLSDVATEVHDLIGTTAPVFLGYSVPDWMLPLWTDMCEKDSLLKNLNAEFLDLRSVYSTIKSCYYKFPEEENRVYKLFLPAKLPRKFGLLAMASEYSLGLQSKGMPPDAPSAKAKLSTLVYEKIMSVDYPDKDSEA